MYSVHLWAPSNYHTARTDRLSPLKVINFVQNTYNFFNLHCRAIRALQIEMINFTSQYNFKVKAQGQTKTICIFKFLTFLLIKWCKEYVSVILLKQKSNKYWGGKTSICSKTISLLDSWVLSLLLGTHVQHFYSPRKRFFLGERGIVMSVCLSIRLSVPFVQNRCPNHIFLMEKQWKFLLQKRLFMTFRSVLNLTQSHLGKLKVTEREKCKIHDWSMSLLLINIGILISHKDCLWSEDESWPSPSVIWARSRSLSGKMQNLCLVNILYVKTLGDLILH